MLPNATAALPAAEPTAAAAPITLASLLGDLIDVDSIARWPSPAYSCRQASSYDRAKIAPDKPGWFANNDNTNFLRTDSIDGRTEQVMLDEPGPGTLVRFWLTAGGEKNGVLRIYLDFGGQVRIDEPMTQGWNVMSRTRHLDAIPFHTSLDFDLELIAWKPTELTSAATTHWYAFPGVTTNRAPLPDQAVLTIPTLAGAKAAALAKIRRKPGARECESLDVVASSGDFRVFAQEMSPWDATRWSGGEHLTVMARQEGDFVELAVPADDDKPRRLLLDLTKAPDFGTLAFAVNGVASAATFDAWAVEVEPGGTIDLGTFSPRDGRFLVRAEVTGANPRSAGARFFFGLDCLVIEPAP